MMNRGRRRFLDRYPVASFVAIVFGVLLLLVATAATGIANPRAEVIGSSVTIDGQPMSIVEVRNDGLVPFTVEGVRDWAAESWTSVATARGEGCRASDSLGSVRVPPGESVRLVWTPVAGETVSDSVTVLIRSPLLTRTFDGKTKLLVTC